MKRLILAVDCDDVLVPATEDIVRTYNLLYGTDVKIEDSHSGDNSEWAVDRLEAERRIHDIQLSDEYALVAPYDEAVKACRRLAEHHELQLITARDQKLTSVTKGMLNKYFPDVFSSIEHLGVYGDKGELCQAIGADVLIDDNMKHLLAAAKRGVSGLIWYGNYPWQLKDSIGQGDKIVRCLDWVSVEKEIDRLAGA